MTCRTLKVIFVVRLGALSVDLVKRSMKAFGPVVYNMYGSTEIAYATIATPKDLGDEPGSVGKVVRGVVVKILDDDGEEVRVRRAAAGSSSATAPSSRATPAARPRSRSRG